MVGITPKVMQGIIQVNFEFVFTCNIFLFSTSYSCLLNKI